MPNTDNKINISDDWKPMADIPIGLSSDFKTASEAYINIGDVWKQWWQLTTTAWLGTWAKRRKITIKETNVDSDLTHYPIPVLLGTSVGIDTDDVSDIFDEVGANSLKIAFTKSDGITELYAEIEQWDDTSESGVVWVSKSDWTIASGTDTEIYIYFDGTQADNTTYVNTTASGAALNVWNTNYLGVWHLNEDAAAGQSSSTHYDSTGTYDGSQNGNARSTGKIAGGQEFDGDNDYVDIPADDTGFLGALTVSVWANIDDDDGAHFAGKHLTSGARDNPFDFRINSLGVMTLVRADGGGFRIFEGPTVTTGAWKHYSYTVTSALIQTLPTFYIDGVPTAGILAAGAGAGAATGTDTNIRIGERIDGGAIMDGTMDEVRISDTTRPAAWVKADYYSGDDNILTWSAAENIKDGWLGTWAYRRKITINNTNVDSDQTYYPLPVFLGTSVGTGTDDVSDIFDEVGANSLKIAFTKDDGTTQLYADIDHWDNKHKTRQYYVCKYYSLWRSNQCLG